MYVEDRHGIDELRILARKAKDGRMRSRLLALALAKGGHTAVHTAEVLGMSRRIVQKWVQRYNEDGLAGLLDAATEAWQDACLDHALIKTVCAAPYASERS